MITQKIDEIQSYSSSVKSRCLSLYEIVFLNLANESTEYHVSEGKLTWFLNMLSDSYTGINTSLYVTISNLANKWIAIPFNLY